jgi:hypothetical protein
MKITPPKSAAIHTSPQEENGIFSKTASAIFIEFQQFLKTSSVDKTA